jgi:hypothetical protein
MPATKLPWGRLDHPMKVIRHQAKGQDVPACFGAGFSEGFQKTGSIGLIAEDVFASVPAIDHG